MAGFNFTKRKNMNIEIIKKLNLTRVKSCLPIKYLNVYRYKKDVYMANTGFFDGTILIYKTENGEYSAKSMITFWVFRFPKFIKV
jgi:hypothetical protein